MNRYVHDFSIVGGLLSVTFDTNPSDAEAGGDRLNIVLSSVVGWQSVEGLDFYQKPLKETHLTIWMADRSQLELRFTTHDRDRWERCYQLDEALTQHFAPKEAA